MKLDEIKGAAVKPKDTVKVETDNSLKVILTKDDLGAMINAMDAIYNLMDHTPQHSRWKALRKLEPFGTCLQNVEKEESPHRFTSV
jgi:hypothetical protein